MDKLKGVIYRLYSYAIPTLALVSYLVYTISYKNKNQIEFLVQDSDGFIEMCHSVANFSSIVLGIYGFLVPIILSKQEDEFVKKFWSLIDREEFLRDMKRVIFSGISTILLSSGLMISDILPLPTTQLFTALLIWLLLFFSCSSYRFIGLFITLIVGKSPNAVKMNIFANPVTEEIDREIKERFDKF